MAYVDLHCHWVAGIDDGARTPEDSLALLTGLKSIGFGLVMATPHMRAGMFDNDKAGLEAAYAATVAALGERDDLPEVGLASEHHMDDRVFPELLAGNGLPYPPKGRAALIEFNNDHFPASVRERLFELRQKRMRPVLAHPERYRPVWDDISVLDPLVDSGTVLLLDIAAVVGKYGRIAQKVALELVEEGYYYAACSDAHKVADIDDVAAGIEKLAELVGREERDFLLDEGPRRIIDGRVVD